MATHLTETVERTLLVDSAGVELEADLSVPPGARGLVMFAHGSGSSRLSLRNRYVAQELREGNLATLLMDLLTPVEEEIDNHTRHLRFNISLLADRLIGAMRWLDNQDETRGLNVGLFGASTGGGAALVAAARRPDRVDAIVSRGGRPDLADDDLPLVRAPTLLIVGGRDDVVIQLNEQAMRRMKATVKLEIVPGASHLFEEPGTLGQVATLTRDWFLRHLS